jgi:hypothetical protein
VLLLLFELETAVIPDEKLRGWLKWFLMAVRAGCYFFIVYAFYGYCLQVRRDHRPERRSASRTSAPWWAATGITWRISTTTRRSTLSACAMLQGEALLRISDTYIIGTRAALDSAFGLALIDIVNAGTWLIIVVLLEAEVWMQLRELLTPRIMKASKYLKGFLYFLLLLCAVYWGFEGSFLDFWDAFLWLVAFIFIEMNIFRWHEETEEAWEAGQAAAGT